MPTYEYRCTECDHTFEAVQAFTDDSIEVCPSCGGRVRKLFGNVGIVFKGSGFYKTDSRDKKSAVSPASEGTSSNGADKSSNGDDKQNKSSGDKVSADSKPSGGSEGSSSKPDSGSAAPAAKPATASTASSSSSSDK